MEQIFITYAVALLAILDPIGTVPFYLTASHGVKKRERAKLAFFVGAFIFFFLTLFLSTGTMILDFFGITLPAFQIAGGVILLFTGIEMIRGGAQTPEKKHVDIAELKAKNAFAGMVVPVGIPLFVGPGSISTAVLYAGKLESVQEKFLLMAATFLVCVIITLVLIASSRLQKTLGKTGLDISTRIMGLIISAISVQFMIDGIKAHFRYSYLGKP